MLDTILKYTYIPYASDSMATHPGQNVLQYCVEFLKNVLCIAYYTAIIASYPLLVNYFVQKSNMVPPPGYDPGSSDFQSVAMTTSAKAG